MTEHSKNHDMYKLYESYKESLKASKKALVKRQKMNAEIREKYEHPFRRKDHVDNVVDITHWNQMIHELEEDMKAIEMYLDFDDRVLLHRDYDNMKSMILNKNSYEGEVPLETLYGASIPDITDIICDVELQEEIVGLLDMVLTERQRQVVQMYFWDGMTQEKIARELGVSRQAVTKIVSDSIEMLRKCVKSSDFFDF